MRDLITIATHTVRALIRDKILYNVLFVGVFLLLVGYWAALLVFGHQDRVMIHLGMAANSLTVLAIAVTTGARIITQETESRLLYLILSKPISRVHYWLGKLAGIGLFLALNLVLLMTVMALGVYQAGGEWNRAFVQGASLLWIESWMMCAFTLWVSLWLSPAVSTMAALSFIFIAHNHEQIEYVTKQEGVMSTVLKYISYLFPRSDQFMLDTRIYYDLPVTAYEWTVRFGYGLIWVSIFVLLGNAFFYRKNL